jgi:hypothetical protein
MPLSCFIRGQIATKPIAFKKSARNTENRGTITLHYNRSHLEGQLPYTTTEVIWKDNYPTLQQKSFAKQILDNKSISKCYECSVTSTKLLTNCQCTSYLIIIKTTSALSIHI